MGFIETVTSKWNHDFKDFTGVFLGMPLFQRTFNKFLLFAHKYVDFLFTHGTAKHICTTQRESGNFLGYLHNLFLINHNAVSFLQKRFKARIRIMNCFRLPFSFNVLRNIGKRTRAVKGVQGNQLFNTTWLTLAKNLLHTWTFKLEDSNRITAAEQVEGFFIFFGNIGCRKFRCSFRPVLVDNFLGISD